MPGDRGPQPTALRVPVNALEREVYRAFEGQYMLNALRRCRPLANPACPIYVLDSAPIEGVEFTRTCRLQDLDFDFDLQAVVDEARMHDRTSAKRKAVQEVLVRMPGAGKDDVQKILERDYPGLDFTSRQVQELICEAYRRSDQVKSTEDPIEKKGGNPRGFILVSRLLSSWSSAIERAVADLTSESQEWVHRQMLKMKRTGQFPDATYVSASRRLDRLWSAIVEVARRGAVLEGNNGPLGPGGTAR